MYAPKVRSSAYRIVLPMPHMRLSAESGHARISPQVRCKLHNLAARRPAGVPVVLLRLLKVALALRQVALHLLHRSEVLLHNPANLNPVAISR